jgi:hypothetical protein
LGTTNDIPALVVQRDIKLVLFTIGEITPKRRKAIFDLCHQAGVRVVAVPDLLDFVRASFQASAGESVASLRRNGAVPASAVLSWLTEVERLARPEDQALVDALARIRAELTK